jgi:outer membrane protein assembly factor BamA
MFFYLWALTGIFFFLSGSSPLYGLSLIISGEGEEEIRKEIQWIHRSLPFLDTPESLEYLLKVTLQLPGVESARIVPSLEDWELEVKTRPYIRSLRVILSDDSLLSSREIEAIFLPRLPIPYSPEVTTTMEKEISLFLSSRGFRGSSVRFSILRKNLALDLEIRIDPGSPLRIGRVIVHALPPGLERVPVPDLEGAPAVPSRIEEELDRWITSIRERGYLTARYTYRLKEMDNPDLRECEITLDAGPPVVFEFSGNRFALTPDLFNALAIDPRRSYSIRSLLEKKEAIRNYYLRHHFPFVEVTSTIEETKEETQIRFSIAEKDRLPLRDIILKGIPPDLQERALDQLSFSPSLWKRILYGKTDFIDPLRIREEAEKIVELLVEEGYLSAKALEWKITTLDERLIVKMGFDPGPRFSWSEVRIQGYGYEKGVEELAELKPHSPARIHLLRKAGEKIENSAREDGYLDAIVETRLHETGNNQIAGEILLYPGPRYRQTGVIISGLRTIGKETILNYVPTPRDGWARPKTLSEGRETLLLTRAFEDVQGRWENKDPALGWAQAHYFFRENPYGGSAEVGLVLATEEGVGADIRLSHDRLFGTFRSIRLDSFVTYLPRELFEQKASATPLRSLSNLNYEEPIPGTSRFRGIVHLGNELNRTGIEYDWLSLIFNAGLLYRETNRITYSAQYDYEWYQRFHVNLPEIEPPGIDRLGGLLFLMDYNALEPLFDPREGFAIHQDLLLTTPALGGDFRFLRYQISGLKVIPMGRVFYLSTRGRGGVLLWRASDPTPPRLKRFRLGGPLSVRGYQRDSISPWVIASTGDAIPIGGDRYLSGQAELQWRFTEQLALVLFQDGGWIGGFSQDVFAWGYGGGLLYHTPLGPIRLEMGWKGIPIPTDTRTQLIHFYFSTTF